MADIHNRERADELGRCITQIAAHIKENNLKICTLSNTNDELEALVREFERWKQGRTHAAEKEEGASDE